MEVMTNSPMLEGFFDRLSGSKAPVLFLDYDGTLAPFKNDRMAAVPYEGLRPLLKSIMEETRTKLVIVTGRPVEDLLPLLDISPAPEVFGSHGWERLRPDGTRETFPLDDAVSEMLEGARKWIVEKGYEDDSESKPTSVTLHWRGKDKESAKKLQNEARAQWGPLGQIRGLELNAFDGGMELRAVGRNKGDAVRAVLSEVADSSEAAFLGDDLTDEDAFEVLKGDGLCVLVRHELRDSKADVWLKPPSELFTFLERWKAATADPMNQKGEIGLSELKKKKRELMIVSNRLPVRMNKDSGEWDVQPAPGGLVTAMNPVLKRNKGRWIGWIGTEPDDEVPAKLEEASKDFPYGLVSVPMTDEEEQMFYRGFSNETLWPLFHDLLGYCKFEEVNWKKYQEINERFADAIMENVGPDDVIWVHDYQLCLVGHYLRKKGCTNRLIFFLHIPFPSTDLYRRLPWRKEIIDALVCYDTVGFHTKQDRTNFVNTVAYLHHDVGVRDREDGTTLFLDDRRVRVGNWAISIDFNEFHDHARSEEVNRESWYFHEHFGEKKLILGLDRLDYTKGIPERLEAFSRFLEKYPEMHGKVCFYQCVVPSRTHVPDYQDLKQLIDMLVGRINGRFSKAGWTPVHYVYRSLSRTELLARYHACELALITPLRDGMNLVCKEYITCCTDDRGVLILSEFAGAAEQLGESAMLVNPFDVEKTADTIYAALTMNTEERRDRMNRLREQVRTNDVHRWVRSIFAAANVELDN